MSCILSPLEDIDPKECIPGIMRRGGVIDSTVDAIDLEAWDFKDAEAGAILEDAEAEIVYMSMNDQGQSIKEELYSSIFKDKIGDGGSNHSIAEAFIEAIRNLSIDEYPGLENETIIQAGTYAIESYNSSAGPLVITGDAHMALGAEDILITSVNKAAMTLSAAIDSDGNTLSVSGSIIHAEADSTGDDHVYLENANISSNLGVLVDLNFDLSSIGGVGKILDMAPEEILTTQPPTTYIHTGAGSDKIKGTDANDFIRGGADNDVIDAGFGDDIVRLGSGTDIATLGPGDDVLYVTFDQLDGGRNIIQDFNSNGEDKIGIDKGIEESITISGQGSKVIIISFSANNTTTTFESGDDGQIIEDEDIALL